MRIRRPRRPASFQYRDRKDHLIDAQVLAIHRLVVTKLQQDTSLLDKAEAILNQRANSGRLSKGNLLSWLGLLDMLRRTDNIADILLDESAEMRRLLRVSPLGALLTETERQQVLAQNAAGQSRADDII